MPKSSHYIILNYCLVWETDKFKNIIITQCNEYSTRGSKETPGSRERKVLKSRKVGSGQLNWIFPAIKDRSSAGSERAAEGTATQCGTCWGESTQSWWWKCGKSGTQGRIPVARMKAQGWELDGEDLPYGLRKHGRMTQTTEGHGTSDHRGIWEIQCQPLCTRHAMAASLSFPLRENAPPTAFAEEVVY